MNRLTDEYGICVDCEVLGCYRQDCIKKKRYDKLKHYEDLEEQGILIKIPCKVGDTVWELCKCDDEVYRIFPMEVKQVNPYGSVRWIKGEEPVIWHIYAESSQTYMYKNFYDFGKLYLLQEKKLRKR